MTSWPQLQVDPPVLGKLALTLVIVLAFWLLRRLALRLAERRLEDSLARYQWQKVTGYVAAVLGILLVGQVWVAGVRNTATFLGLLTAGLAIALQSLLVNLAGWLFILWRRPFRIGDRIQIGAHAGDVIDIRLFQFSLMEIGNWVNADQSTGRVIHVPNGKVFTEVVANYSHGFQYIWNEMPVLITFESNWQEAKRILTEIAEQHGAKLSEAAQEAVRQASRRFLIVYSALTPRVYTSVEDCGVLLTVRYLCEPRRRRGSAEEIWEVILHAFAEREDIDFAYPTRRFYDNAVEGKAGRRPDPAPPAAPGEIPAGPGQRS